MPAPLCRRALARVPRSVIAAIAVCACYVAAPAGALAESKSPLAAATAAKPSGAERYLTKGAPVRITSDKLAVFNKENRAVFTGHVVAKQGDLIIHCDTLVTRYKGGGGLSALHATGNVRVHKGERRGSGQTLVYDHEKRVLELTGAPKLWEKDSRLEGQRIVFHLDEDRVDVERARGNLKMEDPQ